MQKKCRNMQKIPQITEWKYAKHENVNLTKLEMKKLGYSSDLIEQATAFNETDDDF